MVMHIFAFDFFFQLTVLQGIWNIWLTLQLTAQQMLGKGLITWTEEGLLIYSSMSSALNADPTCGFNHFWVIKTFAQPPT